MRNLSDTISRLAAFRAMKMPMLGSGLGQPERLSRLTDFGSNPGALLAWTYVPEGLRADAPLVVVLHGCTQTAAGYDDGAGWSRMADHYGFALLFPEQQRVNNPNLCFNWFVPDDCRRDSGEALSIRQMIETVVKSHSIDRARIYINGLSAGGAMTSVMLATSPDLFAGGAIIAGLPYDCAGTIPEAFDRMRGHARPSEKDLQKSLRGASKHRGSWPTISVWHGADDRTVAPSNADAIVSQWRGVHAVEATPTKLERAKGHSRRIWKRADGTTVIEDYRITGMGHGTPIDVGGKVGDGTAQPFMLDVGFSSTRQLAEQWGLISVVKPAANKAVKRPAATSPAVQKDKVKLRATVSKKSAPEPSQPKKPTGVRKIIEDALRAAGLMR